MELLDLVCDRMICDKMVRARTPPSSVKHHSIPSPSRLAQDQLLLPFMNINGDILLKNQKTSPARDSTSSPEPQPDTNPYSISNIKLPVEIAQPKPQIAYHVESQEEIKKRKSEKISTDIMKV